MDRSEGRTVNQLAEMTGGRVIGDGATIIWGPAPIETAEKGQITFLANPKYAPKLPLTRASAAIIGEDVAPPDLPVIVTKDPYLTFAKVAAFFLPKPVWTGRISPQAAIDSDVVIGEGSSVYPFVSVGAGSRIGQRVTLLPGVVIGREVVIGNDCLIYPNVTILDRCRLGSRVIIHAGTVIGSDGYGFAPDGRAYFKIPQVGIVQIDDDVELGANNTVDRAAMGVTHIKRGVKTDNLVHIAHNVVIGEDTLLVAQVGISGSTKVGNHVIMAGQAGVVGHLSIADDVMIGPQSGVTKSLEKGAVVTGTPAMPHRTFLKTSVLIPKLPELNKTVQRLEKRILELEQKLDLQTKTDAD
ncbi:MAG: UDP-3-O-(3-hydroxymyristoyl)glucosamine N-acyltransferase [Deltaproteobacteria bacterium]|nr:UDP-3-O-(3-hydroxymyristoyl)glucosamine N-acyltransferase [Deltaproteobacteria bacterium]